MPDIAASLAETGNQIKYAIEKLMNMENYRRNIQVLLTGKCELIIARRSSKVNAAEPTDKASATFSPPENSPPANSPPAISPRANGPPPEANRPPVDCNWVYHCNCSQPYPLTILFALCALLNMFSRVCCVVLAR